MKTTLNKLNGILAAAAIGIISGSAHAAITKTNAVPAETPGKSIFQEDLKNGKDPFFPKSTRRNAQGPIGNAPVLAPIIKLALKGISGPANNRLALINNQPITAGETATVRVPGGQIKVRCWEINADSAVISVEGDPEKRELRLRDF